MNTDRLQRADFGSLSVVVLSLAIGLAALPVLPADVAIHWSADESPNTVVPALPGVLLTPAIALLAFCYLRGGALLPGRSAELGPSTGLGVVTGLASLQVAPVALNLGLVANPLLAVAPGVLVVLVATYAGRTGAVSGT